MIGSVPTGYSLMQGDCLELMSSIPDGSVDMVLADLPYGTTACKWDTAIPFDRLWSEYWRVVKDESAVVFSKNGQPQYFPIMEIRDKPMRVGGRGKASAGEAIPNKSNNEAGWAKGKIYTESYPKLIRSVAVSNMESGAHPTQKPVALLEYLIKTYTRENEVVLDNAMGSGSTGVACKNTNRRFIGIEKDPKYFEIATQRLLSQWGNHGVASR